MGVGPAAGRTGEKIIFTLLEPLKLTAELTAKQLFKQAKQSWSHLSEKQARRHFVNYLCSLEKRGLIKKEGSGFLSTIKITELGTAKLDYLSMRRVELKAGEKWDGHWHMVSFDIPENKRKARAAIRRLLKELGCRLLHGSVWIYPLDFHKQTQVIQKLYSVKNHITYFVVDDFDREGEFLNKFKSVIKN